MNGLPSKNSSAHIRKELSKTWWERKGAFDKQLQTGSVV